ncbi:MAG TPA: 4-demethylwyosine synthase TYW1 [Candidatus Aenigmarchaeota archaeon]|nr:4-demethylwyosine synthase TYW1 [Candidatus Aenigmarchaeota archaeon]
MVVKIGKAIETQLRNAHYGVYNHSAVQICPWTKKSIKNMGECYKNTFYGIETHRCMEFSPAAVFCQNNCIFCWRKMEFMRNFKMEDVDEPRDIYENLLKERKQLLSGFFGNESVDRKKLEEALGPTHFAISLSGEPTLYPKLPELIKFLKKLDDTKTIFLVTNAQEPDMFEKLKKRKALPTQLYISTNAPNKALFKRINVPVYSDAWERFIESLEIASGMRTRVVMRLTMIKGLNMKQELVDGYCKLIETLNPHFIEVKAYMWVGYSRRRLKEENMPSHDEVKNYAKKIAQASGFKFIDERSESRVVLLQNKSNIIDRFIKM